jgi:crotonobetainyl-CoA:carnitine CoA-transferase CaiB-like acyl-CoA transferase
MESSSNHTSFFKDLFVLELASVLAGPSAGLFFAECGAHVLKVEAPGIGDLTRTWKTPGETGTISAYYASVNHGKESVQLDLREDEKRKDLQELLAKADVVLLNYRQDVAERFRLSPKQLREDFPRLVIGQVDGWMNPEDQRPAFDIVLQAESGYLLMTGSERDIARLPVAFIDLLAGHQLKEGLLMALMHRMQTGEGSIVRVSLQESAIGALINQASNFLMLGKEAKRMGTLHPNIAPYGEVFTGSDQRMFVLAVGQAKQFAQLCDVISHPALSRDERFSSNEKRLENREKLFQILAAHFRLKPCDYWMQAFKEAGVPAGALRSLSEVFKNEGSDLLQHEIRENTTARSVRSVNFTWKA